MSAQIRDSKSLAYFESLEREWAKAIVEQDRPFLELLLASDFALIVSAAPDRIVTREAWLEMAVGQYRVERAEISRVTLRDAADDLATVSLLLSLEATVGGSDRSTTFFIVDVWRKADAGWQVVTRYSSLPEEASDSSRAVTGE